MADRPLSRPRLVWYLSIIAFAVVFIYFLTIRDMRFFLVPTKSMEPTIHPREYLVAVNAEQYKRGDVVVLDDPKQPGEYLVKRIVGMPGDRVDIRGGALFINGQYISEPYLREPMDYGLGHSYRVAEGEVFVLGDNRNWSVDSHNWSEDPHARPETKGVALDSVLGRVRLVYLPLRDMRTVPRYPFDEVADLTPKTVTHAAAGDTSSPAEPMLATP